MDYNSINFRNAAIDRMMGGPNTRKMARQEHRQIMREERKEERRQRRIERSTGLEYEPKVTKRQIRKWS